MRCEPATCQLNSCAPTDPDISDCLLPSLCNCCCLQSLSDHRACAERRLIDVWKGEARRHGQRPHQIARWIRRKAGPNICVWRRLQDGSLGCSVPCVCCRVLLSSLDLRVSCVREDGEWWEGKLDDPAAPRSKPTTGQRHKHKFVSRPKEAEEEADRPQPQGRARQEPQRERREQQR